MHRTFKQSLKSIFLPAFSKNTYFHGKQCHASIHDMNFLMTKQFVTHTERVFMCLKTTTLNE